MHIAIYYVLMTSKWLKADLRRHRMLNNHVRAMLKIKLPETHPCGPGRHS